MADNKVSGVKYDISKAESSYNKSEKPSSDTTLYEKPLKQKPIQDKTGWTVMPENKEIFKSKGK